MDTGHSDKGRFRARPIPGGKEHTSIQSSPKMRVKNSGYSLFNSKGRNPGKLCQLEAPLWKFQVHQANHSQMEGSQIGISLCFKTSVKRPKFCNQPNEQQIYLLGEITLPCSNQSSAGTEFLESVEISYFTEQEF